MKNYSNKKYFINTPYSIIELLECLKHVCQAFLFMHNYNFSPKNNLSIISVITINENKNDRKIHQIEIKELILINEHEKAKDIFNFGEIIAKLQEKFI